MSAHLVFLSRVVAEETVVLVVGLLLLEKMVQSTPSLTCKGATCFSSDVAKASWAEGSGKDGAGVDTVLHVALS